MKKHENFIDEKMRLLITAGAAMAANGTDLLQETIDALRLAGVSDKEAVASIQVGRMVKDRPAAHMKEVADVLTGTELVSESKKECPASRLDPTSAEFRKIMLISAGSAMAANCEPCLNQVVPNLIEAGVTSHDIKRAVEIGQAVKDRIKLRIADRADEFLSDRGHDQAVA